ncbi:hypothetical protein SFBM_0252 [Candidatus Arthromitus sp. SFB-mouse-Japan]|uniref:hypothetical protein n=1 Tax=unclassified Candidatus Neoarthromitus TaxID=2638829 RepID=UPI00021B7D1C|nr:MULTISPECIES: hypothetical protein [unclassified Candidatus Arthromitus]AID44192.1 Hypothetical protein SFBmNL_00264 [Candidatus Arthromitus sp. SFB-mouse-NL]BAK56031.1 hypothetical protein SFBM_0252 [Candidatus Arthromitus sp. SFB-mouse-Japan]
MKSSGLKVIRNDDYDKFLDLKSGNGKKQKDLIKFGLFIALFLFMFGIIFFAKNRIDTYKNLGEDLNFQKQKIMEERMIMERTLKEERERLSALQLEYENKNKELDNKLESIKEKQIEFDNELKKVYELRDILKNQLVEIYNFNIDNIHGLTNDNEDLSSSNKLIDDSDNTENPIHTSTFMGKDDNDVLNDVGEKILGVAYPDWFIKFNSLGEFRY